MKEALEKYVDVIDEMELQMKKAQVNPVTVMEGKVNETTTTESGTTPSQSNRDKEREGVLSFAASIMEKLKQIDKQLETSVLDPASVDKILARSHLTSTQVSAMMDAIRKMTNLNDDQQYSTLVQVSVSTF